MRLLTQLVSALAILHGALAVDQRKSVIVMFGKDAPNAVIEEAIKTLRDNGGTITHRYEIIKGFAADAPNNAVELMKSMTSAADYGMEVEADEVVTIQG